MALSPGTRIGAYEVRAQLGAGGMGEVYRAHDSRLGRDVALKVLHPDVASDALRLERFTREARAVAALNHPHIVTIYSTEEADGIPFMTMELVEGRALDELIPREGLSLARFFEFALPLADALAAAHQKQITHRDLKPGNVMVATDGRLKVLDFGLARVSSAAPEQTIDATRAVLTVEGTIVGTMPYMSPEQVEGRAIDARSDLFSLGVMFYEMLAGTRPFRGPTSPALMTAILRDEPEPIAACRGDVPEALVRLAARCLEKRPEERVQTARDVYNELRHVQKQLESGAGRRSGSGATAAAPEASLWIAVLPFGTRSADADAESLAAGLTEDVTSGLSRFPALSVLARESAQAYRNSPLSVQQIAERLGARYVLGGTVRRSAAAVRIATHLVDARSGAHLWTETYDQALEGTDLFAIQDEVTDRIVATVADMAGVLARSMVQAVRQLPVDQLSARELLFRGWAFQWSPTPAAHHDLRAALEQRLEASADPHLWAQLAHLYVCEYSLMFDPRPDSLARAARAARRAIEIDPGHQDGWLMLATVSFYLKDEATMHEAGDRAIRLNPRNANVLAWLGNTRTHAGDYDAGSALTKRAMALNPAHPGWYHFAAYMRHFAREEYADALKAARRVNMPEFVWMPYAVAAAAGQLGLAVEARAAYDKMVSLAPPLADDAHLRELTERWNWQPALVEGLLEGLARAKAATDAPQATRQGSVAARAPRPPSSGSGVHALSAHRVAVVPFTSRDGDAEAAALASGLTEDIAAGLGRFSYLSVDAASTPRTQHESTAARRAAARYALDGNLRRTGEAVRLVVRLVDSTDGRQLWTRTYDRSVAAGDLLRCQDELTDHIVSTVGDVSGALLRAMSLGVEDVAPAQLDVDALTLRYWAYQRQHAPTEHGLLREAFERVVGERPTFAFAWSALAHLYCHEHGFQFNLLPDPLGRARRALGKALELDAVDQHGWEALALTYFFERDPEGFAHASERAVTLNPRNANALAMIGVLRVHTGDLDGGCALVERAMALNPDHPGWYHIAACNRHLLREEFAEALRAAKRINMPQHIWAHVLAARAAGELGRAVEAASAIDGLLAIAPAMEDIEILADATRRWKWDDAVVDQMMEGYRKAVALRAAAGPRSRPPSSGAGSTESGAPSATPAAAAPRAIDLTLAVLPFTARADDPQAQALADALTDDVTTGLSRFEHLRVLSRAAAAQLASAARSTSKECRYVLDGTVRSADAAVRVSVRIVDTHTSSNVWAANLDVDAEAGTFAVQDDLASRIVATVGDPTGVLARAMNAALAGMPIEQLGAEPLMVRYFAYTEQFRPDDHARLRDAVERFVEREAASSVGWAMAGGLYHHEHSHLLNPLPDSLGRARQAIERAIALDSRCQHAWVLRAAAHLFAGDSLGVRAAVERAVSINPLNAELVALCALYLSIAEESPRAVELAHSAIRLKPQHPGWYHFALFNALYRDGQDTAALAEATQVDMPMLPLTHMCSAAVAGQLGRSVDARLALDQLRSISASLCTLDGAADLWKLWVTEPRLLARLIDGFGKALALAARSDSAPPPKTDVGRAGDARSAIAVTDAAARVAVLPFTARGGDIASGLADALTDDITTGLSRFPHLRVVPAPAAATLTTESAPRAGVRYLLDGRVQGRGSAVRVTVRLIDGSTGANLWADTFDRPVGASAFDVQDELASYVAATVGDTSGVLARSMVAPLLHRPVEELTVRELTLRFHAYVEHFQPEEHARLRSGLERALEREPLVAEGWACLADLYEHEHSQFLNPLPDSLGRQRRAARRALDIDPHNQRGWTAMAGVHTFERDLAGLRMAAERAIALNPLDADTVGLCALFLSCAGDDDRAMELFARAVKLKPQHPGWYHFPPFTTHFKRREYAAALAEAKRIALPQLPTFHMSAAAAAARVGSRSEVAAPLEALRRLDPQFLEPEPARQAWALWLWDDTLVQDLVDGLMEALALTAAPGASRPPSSGTTARRAGLAISVTPFGSRGGDDAAVLAAGLTEDVTTGLSRFGNLKVLARGARYLLDGSVSQAGQAVRVTARVVDSETAATIWSQAYERPTTSGAFALQDDLASRIVSTVADPTGVLGSAMAATIGDSAYDALGAAELVVRFHVFTAQLRPVEHSRLRQALERALEREPEAAEGWACLAHLYGMEHGLRLNPLPGSRERERRAAERALEIDPQSPWAWTALARSHLFARDGVATRAAVDRALALNPLNADMLAHCAIFLTSCGDFDRAVALVTRAMELKPHHQGWFYLPIFDAHYVRGEDGAALDAAKKIHMPAMSYGQMSAAAAAGQLGLVAEAQASLDTLRQHAPELLDPAAARAEWGVWLWDEALLARLVQGLEKALALTGEARAGSDAGAAAAPGQRESPTAQQPPSSTSAHAGTGAAAGDSGMRVAVLPFTARGGDDASALAEGLTDDLTTALARFPYLQLASRGAVRSLGGHAHEAGARLGARFLLEGVVRVSSGTVRVSTHLADAHTGAHVWAETFERDLAPGLFAVQDDIVGRIAATVGDGGGALVRALARPVHGRPIADLAVGDLVLRYHGDFAEHFDPADHAALRDAFEAAVTREPGAAAAWACLSTLYAIEIFFGLNPKPDPLGRLRDAAARANRLDADHQQGWVGLATAALFDRDRVALQTATGRIVELNPFHSRSMATVGLYTVFAGETSRGVALVERSIALNPRYPGWYLLAFFLAAYERGDFEAALRTAKSIGMPQFVAGNLAAAAAAGQVGTREDATPALEALARFNPRLTEPEGAREVWSRWIWDGATVDRLVDGLVKARALTRPPCAPGPATRAQSSPVTSNPRTPSRTTAQAASVAVLPFADLSPAKDQEWFCDGVAEEILNALTQLPGLHVAARTSAFSFRGRGADLRGIAETLKVATVLQGSVRRAGDRLRITVQLVDATSGFQLWSERYDREIADIFDVQDEIARGVAERLKVTLAATGVFTPERRTTNIAAYELYLKGRALLYQRGASLLPALEAFRQSTALDPAFAPAWAGLADAYTVLTYLGALPVEETRRQCIAAARRALALDSRSAEAHTAMACAELLFRGDVEQAGRSFQQALALNPHYVQGQGWYAVFYMQWSLGRLDEGIAEARKGVEADPLSAYAHLMLSVTLYTASQYEEAIAVARRAIELDARAVTPYWILGASLGRLGNPEALDVLRRGLELSGRNSILVVALCRAGGVEAARRIYAELLAGTNTAYVTQTQLAIAAWAAGLGDAAVAHVERALAAREPMFLLLARHTPEYRDMRAGDPRIDALVRQLDTLPPLADVD